MSNYLLLFPILFPSLVAITLCFRVTRGRRVRNSLTMTAVCINSAVVLALAIFYDGEALTLLRLTPEMHFLSNVDGLSRIFAAMVAVLWPLTTLYAFDYMKTEGHENRFFAFFLCSYGVVCGVAFAGNPVTLYLFFELLTLATLPLVMHRMDGKARFAGKKYLLFSMTGAAFGFISVVFIVNYCSTSSAFVLGGVLDPAAIAGNEQLLRAVFVLAFFGFGVKAALLPMSSWLPSASVAPTPVTALLHAVAVVKAGAFACIRLTYYSFGTELLAGTFAQYVPMCAASLTIIVGSFLALRSNHLKRRLAWSTASNLSYILLGVAAMTPLGLIGALEHMVFHAFVKITLFFCVGAILNKTEKEYLDEINGLAKRMPVTFACFTFSGIALMGVPPLPIFFSKLHIGQASAAVGPFGWFGVAALALSSLLTVLYIIETVVRGYMQKSDDAQTAIVETKLMNAPILILVGCILALGLLSGAVSSLIESLIFAGGVL